MRITEDLGRIYIQCTSDEAKVIISIVRGHVVIKALKTKIGSDGIEIAGKINHIFFLRKLLKL
jgi:hypothetical protein